jgi:hypothetical protein
VFTCCERGRAAAAEVEKAGARMQTGWPVKLRATSIGGVV